MTHHLVGPQEIANLLGVSTTRVHQIATSYEDFPAPEAELATGRIWKRSAIDAWIKKHPKRKAGRPRKASG